MSLSFQKRKENFKCGHCGKFVYGDGYTNHCPFCLWGKHVDLFPGDRRQNCGGMMKPVSIEIVGDKHMIIHKCEKCGATKKNKINEKDNFEIILKLSASIQKV